MANYLVVKADTNLIIDTIRATEDQVSANSIDYDSSVGEVFFVAEPTDNMTGFEGIGNEYIASEGKFQPVEALSDSWTKNANGVWDAIHSRPDGHYGWSDISNQWVVFNPDVEDGSSTPTS